MNYQQFLKISWIEVADKLKELTTTGAISSGFIASNISGGKISSVSLEAAVGTIVFTLMLYLAPSMANVFDNPTRPNFAALPS